MAGAGLELEHDAQVKVIARCLSTMLPAASPITPHWAHTLYEDFGMRVHPELAKSDVAQPVQDAAVVHQTLDHDLLAVMKDLGGRVPAVKVLADRVESAQTEQQRDELLAEIRAKFPEQIADVEQRVTQQLEPEGDVT